jgi:hypothetical protein
MSTIIVVSLTKFADPDPRWLTTHMLRSAVVTCLTTPPKHERNICQSPHSEGLVVMTNIDTLSEDDCFGPFSYVHHACCYTIVRCGLIDAKARLLFGDHNTQLLQ